MPASFKTVSIAGEPHALIYNSVRGEDDSLKICTGESPLSGEDFVQVQRDDCDVQFVCAGKAQELLSPHGLWPLPTQWREVQEKIDELNTFVERQQVREALYTLLDAKEASPAEQSAAIQTLAQYQKFIPQDGTIQDPRINDVVAEMLVHGLGREDERWCLYAIRSLSLTATPNLVQALDKIAKYGHETRPNEELAREILIQMVGRAYVDALIQEVLAEDPHNSAIAYLQEHRLFLTPSTEKAIIERLVVDGYRRYDDPDDAIRVLATAGRIRENLGALVRIAERYPGYASELVQNVITRDSDSAEKLLLQINYKQIADSGHLDELLGPLGNFAKDRKEMQGIVWDLAMDILQGPSWVDYSHPYDSYLWAANQVISVDRRKGLSHLAGLLEDDDRTLFGEAICKVFSEEYRRFRDEWPEERVAMAHAMAVAVQKGIGGYEYGTLIQTLRVYPHPVIRKPLEAFLMDSPEDYSASDVWAILAKLDHLEASGKFGAADTN